MRFPLCLQNMALALSLILVACATSGSAKAALAGTTGIASFYHDSLHGNLTANGETFDQQAMTAAHRTLPFDTRVRVTNLKNKRSLELRINDRGPFIDGRIIDVSRAAAEKLGFVEKGLANVRVEVLD